MGIKEKAGSRRYFSSLLYQNGHSGDKKSPSLKVDGWKRMVQRLPQKVPWVGIVAVAAVIQFSTSGRVSMIITSEKKRGWGRGEKIWGGGDKSERGNKGNEMGKSCKILVGALETLAYQQQMLFWSNSEAPLFGYMTDFQFLSITFEWIKISIPHQDHLFF